MNRRRGLMVMALLPASWPCMATVTFSPSVDAGYQYLSNVFDLPGGSPVPGTTDFHKSDSLYTYGAALDAHYLWDRQDLYAKLSDTEYRYDHFSFLNHNEYNADGGLNFKLGRLFDGNLEVLRSYQMVAFTNVGAAQFDQLMTQRENGLLGFALTPDWRLEGSGYYQTQKQTYTGQGTTDLTETQEKIAVKYVALAGLTAGLNASYTNGNYAQGVGAQPSYEQKGYDFIADYASGHSTVEGEVGYTDRSSSSPLNDASGVTGRIDYRNQLTGKTYVDLMLTRAINNYVSNLGSELDTAGLLTVNWQATYKIDVALGYNYTLRELPGQGNSPGTDRIDHLQLATLNIDYAALRWLDIQPYVEYQVRGSDYIGANFNATVIGMYFTITPYGNAVRRRPPMPLTQ